MKQRSEWRDVHLACLLTYKWQIMLMREGTGYQQSGLALYMQTLIILHTCYTTYDDFERYFMNVYPGAFDFVDTVASPARLKSARCKYAIMLRLSLKAFYVSSDTLHMSFYANWDWCSAVLVISTSCLNQIANSVLVDFPNAEHAWVCKNLVSILRELMLDCSWIIL